MEHTSTDCRSEVGTTVGIVDSIIVLMGLLEERDHYQPEVKAALMDLTSTEEFHTLVRYWYSYPD